METTSLSSRYLKRHDYFLDCAYKQRTIWKQVFYVDFNFHADVFSNLDILVNVIFQYQFVWLVINIPASDMLI
jgi:hypothetical protein